MWRLSPQPLPLPCQPVELNYLECLFGWQTELGTHWGSGPALSVARQVSLHLPLFRYFQVFMIFLNPASNSLRFCIGHPKKHGKRYCFRAPTICQHYLSPFLPHPPVLTALQSTCCYTHFTDQEDNAQVVKEIDSQGVGCKAGVHIQLNLMTLCTFRNCLCW